MFLRSLSLIAIAFLFSAGALVCFAQSADNKSSIYSKPEDDDNDRPKNFKETLEKLRIDKEKKEYGQMLERGEEALKISEELEKAYAHNGRLTEREIAKLAAVEKLVKKIRSDLGGDDDGDNSESAGLHEASLPAAEAVKSFRSTTVKLFDELKKTTRFTISAAAIQTSNAVLKLARFLRIAN